MSRSGTWRRKKAAPELVGSSGAAVWDSGDDRLSRRCTIMGPAGLTAVFGMGTGVTPPVWSPEIRPPRRSGRGGRDVPVVGHDGSRVACTRREWARSCSEQPGSGPGRSVSVSPPRSCLLACLVAESRSGWSSCLAVRTGRLRRSPAVHARPIDLVVFQEPSQHLLLETSSRRGLRA